ncbi:unnamed protein product [Adineta ricciae]|uniref:Uncharacterized protein n=1 Tax=Adineta ricciae TaxID=249248 RepID=A0A814XI85_ADIRI|nr:unnamed protein product [Adineta ricciae]
MYTIKLYCGSIGVKSKWDSKDLTDPVESHNSRVPKNTGVDRTRRQCSAETIRRMKHPSKHRCTWSAPKIRFESASGLNETSAGFQTDENRY